ncbi:MAG: hypothetical protein ABEJ69_02790 [Candidatus Nanohaloarchaea archaeon]
MGFLKQPGAANLFEDDDGREESPWMIDSDLEEKIKREAREKNKTPGEEFRDAIRRGL